MPRKTGLNCSMPAMVSMTVGSSGTKLALGSRVCPLQSRCRLQNQNKDICCHRRGETSCSERGLMVVDVFKWQDDNRMKRSYLQFGTVLPVTTGTAPLIRKRPKMPPGLRRRSIHLCLAGQLEAPKPQIHLQRANNKNITHSSVRCIRFSWYTLEAVFLGCR